MADNVTANVGSGGETFASDDIAGVQYPFAKIAWGPLNTANGVDTATGKPFPMQVRSATGLIPVGEPTDAKSTATDTTSVSIVSILKQISASVQAPASTAVTGTFWQATQPVSLAINTPVGSVAHDGVDSGAPVKIGTRAVATLSTATLVAAADRSDAVADLDGAVIMRGPCPLGDIVSGVDADTDGSSTAVIVAQGAGVKVYITWAVIDNAHATTKASIDLRDGAAGAVKATLPAPAAGGGMFTFNPPLAFSADTAVCADPSAAVTTLTTTLGGYKSKV